jgi:hypothetical protein
MNLAKSRVLDSEESLETKNSEEKITHTQDDISLISSNHYDL